MKQQDEEPAVPEIERPEPPYLQVVRHLRDEIASGRLAEGEQIPSVRQISAEWGIAHATASKVLTTLRGEGLTEVQRGRTVVASQAARRHSARDHSIAVHRTGRIYPPGHYARIRAAEVTEAPAAVATALGLDPAAAVIRRRRTTYNGDDTPIAISTSWFDAALAADCPDLLRTERIVAGTTGYIRERTGRVPSAGYDQVAAGVASADDAAELAIDEGSAVLLARNRWLDQDGEVIEYGESVSPAGRWAFYEYSIRSEQP